MGYAIIFDTETTTDERQTLVFGWFRYVHVDEKLGTLSVLAEGIIHADNVTAERLAILREYAENHTADIDVDFSRRAVNPRIYLISRTEFALQWIWKVVYKQDATLVGFNLPFDISRIAVEVGAARKSYKDGFSYTVFTHLDGTPNEFRPRIAVKPLDSKKSFIGFTGAHDGQAKQGNFLDLRTLSFALTNTPHSLASACTAYGVEHGKMETTEHGTVTVGYIDYARRDVQATTELYGALVADLATHPVRLTDTMTFSPASMAKAYMRAMRIPRPLERETVPEHIIGYAMSSFFGARAECRIRRVPTKVSVWDFTSMYPTVNALMGLWGLLTADTLTAVPDAAGVQRFLEAVTLDGMFSPDLWRELPAIARIRPDGDVLPVRAKYGRGGSWNIGINRLTLADDDQWYALPDLVASVLLTGRVPTVLEAYRFVGTGTAKALRRVKFGGHIECDPRTDDYFTLIVEERAKVKGTRVADLLKVLANAGCYGIFAELNRTDLGKETNVSMLADGEMIRRDDKREVPGPYTFPPFATVITAAARLMLAMLERCVTDAGGSWVFTDTDSMAINVETLSEETVAAVAKRFNSLNPYKTIPDLLKLEYVGWCYCISAKRYVLYSEDRTIDKYSSHGLGHLISPGGRDWIKDAWRYVLWGDETDWLDKPALSRYTVTRWSMYESFRLMNDGLEYANRVKPANFILIAHGSPMQPTKKSSKILPITPFNVDSDTWETGKWINKHTGLVMRIGTLPHDMVLIEPGVYYVQTYRDVLNTYGLHVESKFDTADGRPCYPSYCGPLIRKHVKAVGKVWVGKEANEIEPVQLGLLSESEVQTAPQVNVWALVAPFVGLLTAHLSLTELSVAAGIPRSTVGHIRAGRPPRPAHQDRMIRLLCVLAADDMDTTWNPRRDDPVTWLNRWWETIGSNTAEAADAVECEVIELRSRTAGSDDITHSRDLHP